MKIAYFSILALMVLLAFLCCEWRGIWIIEGILTGLALVAADVIHKENRKPSKSE